MAGSVKQDKNGTWYYILELGKDDKGKRKQKKKRGFKRKGDAQKALRKAEHEVNQGTYVEPSKMLYSEHLKKWLELKTGIRKSTFSTYDWLINKHIIPNLGDIPLQELKPKHLEEFYKKLSKEDKQGKRILSDENVSKIHSLIHQTLEKAVRWEYVSKNVAILADKPKINKKEMEIWDLNEISKFLTVAKNDRLYIAFLLAVTTGMRQGEILGLRWKDINTDDGFLNVQQTLSHNGKEFGKPKSEKGIRKISLDDVTVAELKRHKAKVAKEKLSAGTMYGKNDLVVCTKIGTPLLPRNLLRTFYRLIEKAKIKKIRFHDLRHSHATWFLHQDKNIKNLQKRLGHSTSSITLDIYSHVTEEIEKESAKNFGKMLFGEKSS